MTNNGNMIHDEYKKKQKKIVSNYETFKKKCIDKTIILNDKYLEDIEECMLDVEDFIIDKEINEYINWVHVLVYYKYDIKGKDVQKFIDLNSKLDEYMGKKAYRIYIEVNGKKYNNLPRTMISGNIVIRYWFDKLTKKFLNKED